jgi:hypothetical protein
MSYSVVVYNCTRVACASCADYPYRVVDTAFVPLQDYWADVDPQEPMAVVAEFRRGDRAYAFAEELNEKVHA